MLPLVGCESERSLVLWRLMIYLVLVEHVLEFVAHLVVPATRRHQVLAAGELGRLAEHQRHAVRVELVERVADGRIRAAPRRGVGLAAFGRDPQVLQRAPRGAARSPIARTRLAAFEARMIVSWSPCSSMPKPATGLPVA